MQESPNEIPEGETPHTVSLFAHDICRAPADWLEQCGIETIAMQSTGVYWMLCTTFWRNGG